MKKILVVLICLTCIQCKFTGTIAPPTPVAACAPFNYTPTFTLPPGVTGTITGVTGLPPSLTPAFAPTPAVTGTPLWSDAGRYTVKASGTVTSPVSFFRSKSWSAKSNVVITPPAHTIAPAAGFTIPAFAQISNKVTINVVGAPPAAPCAYSAQFAKRIPGLAYISVIQNSPLVANGANSVVLQLSRETNVAYTGSLKVTLIPTGGGPNIILNVPVTAL